MGGDLNKLTCARMVPTLALMLFSLANSNDAAAQAAQDCQQYDQFVPRGGVDPIPSPCQTVDPELGGLRKALAANGIGISVSLAGLVTYNLRGDGGTPQQLYSGQKPTYNSTFLPMFTYDLGRLGLNQGSQFTFKPVFNYNSFRGNGQTGFSANQLSVYLPFYDNNVIVQAGFYYAASIFYGTNIGDIAGAAILGPSSTLPFATGIQGWLPTPALDITTYFGDKHFYNHFGVTRSADPVDPLYEWNNNRSGLNPYVRGGRPAFIDEVGYKVNPAPGQNKVWFRAGAIYNTSGFPTVNSIHTQPYLSGSYTNRNYGFYGILDYQLTQPNPGLPFQGWYVNIKADYGSQLVNVFSSDVGLTLYKIGTFASRPFDLLSLSVGRNFISSDFVDFADSAGIGATRGITTASVSYAYLVKRGIYWNNAFLYSSTPTVAPQRKAALSIFSSVTLEF